MDVYLLFFLHIETRRVFVSGITANPDTDWVAQQARNASMQFADWGLGCSHLLIDHDTWHDSAGCGLTDRKAIGRNPHDG